MSKKHETSGVYMFIYKIYLNLIHGKQDVDDDDDVVVDGDEEVEEETKEKSNKRN